MTPQDLRVPDHVPAGLVRDFDHVHGPALDFDAFTVHREAPTDRVFYSPFNGGYWVLTKAEDIRAALQAHEVFSSSATGIPAHPSRREKMYPLELDPPEHRPHRQILTPFFAPKAVVAKAQAIRRVCVELLDPARRAEAGVEINAYLRDLIELRAADPQDDLVSRLLDTSIDGVPVTRDTVQNFTFLLFVAGLDTVTAALAFAFRFLAERPAHRQQLLDEPDVIPGAVEELLRVFSFINMGRTVTHDVEFAGVQMKSGDRLLASTTFASMDPDEFDAPLVVDFRRRANRHLAFGAGPHRCAGSHLAREELRTAITEFHRRIPHYEVVRANEIRMHGGGAMGIDRLDLRWPPTDSGQR